LFQLQYSCHETGMLEMKLDGSEKSLITGGVIDALRSPKDTLFGV